MRRYGVWNCKLNVSQMDFAESFKIDVHIY